QALAAAKPGDYFMSPQFLSVHHLQKPTDFNDLFRLYGLKTLQQVTEQVWQYEPSPDLTSLSVTFS
ncbi:MAG: hypothetical protein NWQ54_25590, partial [Paraglaciecola sp.]|nr:hypothetical protein [Paraglaciecola sp.]